MEKTGEKGCGFDTIIQGEQRIRALQGSGKGKNKKGRKQILHDE
jgi:hypothetical protein